MTHMQTAVDGWLEHLDLVPDNYAVKSVNDQHLLRDAKLRRDTVFTCFRYHHDDLQRYSTDWEDMVAKWRDLFPRFVDDTFRNETAPFIDAVEEHNEYLANDMGWDEIHPRLVSAQAAVHVWNTDYRPTFDHDMRLVIANAPVGNSIPREFAELAIGSNNILGYHPYTLWENKERADYDHPYVSTRFDLDEDLWRQEGLDTSNLRWLFTECGPYAGAWDGWRSSACLDGDEDLLIEAMRLWIRDAATTEAYQEGRILGFNMFTSNRGGWDHFQLFAPQLNRLAAMIAEEWAPGQGAPPDPSTPLEEAIWDASIQEQIERGIPLNPNALLQSHILDDGFTPVHRERRYRAADGTLYAYQAAETVDGSLPRRVYRCIDREDGTFGRVLWFEEPGELEQTGITFPVGTQAEREAATDDWPGEWIDANPFGNRYVVRAGREAYHTGADLNLNTPVWDSDRGQPVFAIADGTVTYAGEFNDAWGIIVVIDHGGFYSRYSAVAGILVAVGDVVTTGQRIAVVDQHGEGEPYHLHFDISTTETLAENPGDWPGLTWSRLERDYVDPLPFILGRR